MLDNVTLVITKKTGEHVEYNGVCFASKEEASQLLHPDYWNEIPVGHQLLIGGDRNRRLMRLSEEVMLIMVNGSRNFVQIGELPIVEIELQ